MNNNVDFNNQLQSVSVENYEYKKSPVEEKTSGNGFVSALISSIVSILYYGAIVSVLLVVLIEYIKYGSNYSEGSGSGIIIIFAYVAGLFFQFPAFVFALSSESDYKKSQKEKITFGRKFLHVLSVLNICVTIIWFILLILPFVI